VDDDPLVHLHTLLAPVVGDGGDLDAVSAADELAPEQLHMALDAADETAALTAAILAAPTLRECRRALAERRAAT